MASRLYIRTSALRAGRTSLPVRRPFAPVTALRFKTDISPSSSDADYGAPTGPSGASDSTSQGINARRSTEGAGIENTGIANPVSSSDSTTGASEEEQIGVGDIHQPFDKPASEKAKQTLAQGNKKLDPADD